MQCKQCNRKAQFSTTALFQSLRVMTVYHCFQCWDEAFEATNRRGEVGDVIGRIVVVDFRPDLGNPVDAQSQ